MKQLISILADVDDAEEDAVEIRSEADGSLAVETLVDRFTNACGLQYLTEVKKFKRVQRKFGYLNPPKGGWGDTYYVVIFKGKGGRYQCVPNTNLVVTCLPWNCSNADLSRHFKPHGQLKVCNAKKDPETGLCEGFGIIQYKTNSGRRRTLAKDPVVNGTRWNICVADPMLTELFFAKTLSSKHLTALDAVVEEIYVQHGLSDQDLVFRQRMFEKIQQYLDDISTGMQLHLYGSSLTGLGLKTSNVNLLLDIPDRSGPAEILTKVFEALRTASEDIVRDVRSDFTAIVPAVLFKSPCGTVEGKITVRTDSAYYSSQYLKLYADRDPRVRRLAVALRHWASICGVDEQEKGFLPSYAFGLMTVYYLQQCEPPVLPVLAERAHTAMANISNSKEHDYFAKNFLKSLQKSAQQNVSSSNMSLVNVGRLWRGLLMFYDVKFDSETFVVCVRRREQLPRSEKKWGGRTLAIEDPFSRRNVSRPLHNEVCDTFFKACLRQSSLYFSLPNKSIKDTYETKQKTRQGRKDSTRSLDVSERDTLLLHLSDDEWVDDDEKRNACSGQLASYSASPSDTFTDQGTFEAAAGDEDDDTDNEQYVDELHYWSQEDVESDDSTGYDDYRLSEDSDYDEGTVLYHRDCPVQNAHESAAEAGPPEYKYDFHPQNFRGLEDSPVICTICNQQGHYGNDCPSIALPTVDQLPEIEQFFLDKMTLVMRAINDREGMSQKEYNRRTEIVADLGGFIQRSFKGAKLQLFGSSGNGFGFRTSDLDISISFQQETDAVSCAERLCYKLRHNRYLENVYAITTAKVPIVKFKMMDEEVEGDFSFNNDVAVRNTQLLNMYNDIDERVRPLVLAIKWLAKRCDIGDASKGTLSSYAYTLMVLHYLQHTDPPVLPVLQEIDAKTPRRKRKRKYLVDDWETYFYSDLDNLHRKWSGYGQNTQSEGELWLGFFRYYIEEFNFDETVVTIRVFDPLSKFDKFWNASTMAIEDPFVLSHNLAGALSRKMSHYIRNTFALARKLYGTPRKDIKKPRKFFFDKHKLTDGDLPFVRLCTKCQKIGHTAKDCRTNQRNRKGFSRRR